MTYFGEVLETWSNHTQTSFPTAHFSTKHHAITLQAYQSKVESSKKVATLSGRLVMEKNGKEIRQKTSILGVLLFFLYFPQFLDPKCYTWLESYGRKDSHGKKLQIFGVTIRLTEFCQHFGIQIITLADTLS